MAYEAWYGSFGAYPFNTDDEYPDGVLRRAFRGNQIYLDDPPAHANESVRQAELDAISSAYEFESSINTLIAQGDFSEGRVDKFSDETGVDTAASSNEVYSAEDDAYSPDEGTDMSLISEGFEVDWMPFVGGIVIEVEEIDEIEVNTDVKAYISGNGSDWTQVTLSKVSTFGLSRYVLVGTEDVGVRGEEMRWKIDTDNEIDIKIHSVGLLWR